MLSKYVYLTARICKYFNRTVSKYRTNTHLCDIFEVMHTYRGSKHNEYMKGTMSFLFQRLPNLGKWVYLTRHAHNSRFTTFSSNNSNDFVLQRN